MRSATCPTARSPTEEGTQTGNEHKGLTVSSLIIILCILVLFLSLCPTEFWSLFHIPYLRHSRVYRSDLRWEWHPHAPTQI